MRHAKRIGRLGGLAVALGIGATLTAGTAQADGGQWCPGHPLPDSAIKWDMTVCHNWYRVQWGQGNVSQSVWEGENGPPPKASGPVPPLWVP
jgi:hypothetical protein